MSEIEQLVDIIKLLRGDNGCPWDREQTHSSLKAACIEEVEELLEKARARKNPVCSLSL